MKAVLLFLFASSVFAETGIRARATISDYPSHDAHLGVAVLSPDQTKKLFAVDLTKMGYIVVEVGIYPERDVEVASRDFMLRNPADGTTYRPVTASAIAGKLEDKKTGKSSPPRIPAPVQVFGSQTVGYGTGTYNGRRTGGVYTESTVGVGVGGPGMPPPPPPAPSKHKDKDAMSVQAELEASGLPEGRLGHPVAGYLYFPAPPKKAALEFTWYAEDGQVHLTLPSTK
jgi:hypothetical protein